MGYGQFIPAGGVGQGAVVKAGLPPFLMHAF